MTCTRPSSHHSHVAFSSHMAPGFVDPTRNGLQLGTQVQPARCWPGRRCYRKQKLWAVALIPGQLKARWMYPWPDAGKKGHEHPGLSFHGIKMAPPPVLVSGKSFLCATGRPSRPLVPGGGAEGSPQLTPSGLTRTLRTFSPPSLWHCSTFLSRKCCTGKGSALPFLHAGPRLWGLVSGGICGRPFPPSTTGGH